MEIRLEFCNTAQFKVLISGHNSTWSNNGEKRRTGAIRRVEPYVRRSGASLQERRGRWCELILGDSPLHEPWRYVPWHLESSAHSSPCVEQWDNAQPTVRYLT